MHSYALRDWMDLAQSDSGRWSVAVRENISECLRKTGRSVVSADLSVELSLGEGPMAGLPYAIKDLYDYKGWPSHCSSVLPELLDCPAGKNSELVERLQTLGATCVAKAQMHEFAYGLSGENPHYGNCPHPLMAGCLSGGSSSGSAHLVAAGYLPVAFGTDTGGSIRLPAAWCGLFGVRWTPGLWMEGGFPLAPSFDSMGWFTRTAEDMRAMLTYWLDRPDPERTRPLSGGVFLAKDFISGETFAALDRATRRWEMPKLDACADILTWLPECNGAFNVLQSREAYAIHEIWLGRYGDRYDPEVKARIERGASWSAADVASAEAVQARVKAWFAGYFSTFDFLAMPVCPGPSITRKSATPDLREKTLKLTGPASLAGLPVLTLPVWLDPQRSVGLQCIFKNMDARVPLALLERCES